MAFKSRNLISETDIYLNKKWASCMCIDTDEP